MEAYCCIFGIVIGLVIGLVFPMLIKKKEEETSDMKCPECGGDARVTDTVSAPENEVYRRRKCVNCDHAFYTVEFEAEANDKFMEEWKKYHRKCKW